MSITIKVHNVLHDEEAFDKELVEEYIEDGFHQRDVSVRVAPGGSNSPLFLEVGMNSLSFDTAKSIVREAVRAFSVKVSGVNVEKTVRDSNILIVTGTQV